MDPVTIGAIGSGVGSVIGGIFGNSARRRQEREARRQRELAVQELQGVRLDDISTLLSAYGADTSASDPAREYEMGALEQMADLSRTGMGAQDRAAMLEVQNQQRAAEKSQRDAILQQLAMRGQAGGGAEVAAQLSANQGFANRANAYGSQIAGQAADRRAKAIQATGSMASSRAQALDELAKFNAAGRRSAYGDAWNQRFGRAGAIAGARTGASNLAQQQSAGQAGPMAGIGGAAGTAVAMGANALFKKRNSGGSYAETSAEWDPY